MWEEMGQNFVLTGMIAFVLKNFGSTDWLGPKDMISELEQKLPKNLLDPCKWLIVLWLTPYYEKNGLNIFFTGMIDFFS